MDMEIKKGNTVVVKGATRVKLLEGELEILGKEILPRKDDESAKDPENGEGVVIVPSALTFPLFATKNSKLEIFTSDKDNIELVNEHSIPLEWRKTKDTLIQDIKNNEGKSPLKIMVLGISSGKTTLIKYLANHFIRENLIGGYLDSDLGQQILLPTTLMIGLIEEPFIDLKRIEEDKRHFVGATFPKGNLKFIVSHYTKTMIDEFTKKHKNLKYILIDTDGWVKTEAGCVYKNYFIKKVDPDVLIVFYDKEIEEYDKILSTARERKDRKIIVINEKNKYFYEKSKEERRFLRQSRFAQVFEAFQKVTIPLNELNFIKRDYDIEKDEIVEININIRNLINLPYHYVIVGLLDENSNLLNVALLFTANIDKNYALLFTDLSYKEQRKIKKILLGSLRLSIKGNHQGYLYI